MQHTCARLQFLVFFFLQVVLYSAVYYDNYIIIIITIIIIISIWSSTGSHTDTYILSGMYPACVLVQQTRRDDDVSLNDCADDHPTGRWDGDMALRKRKHDVPTLLRIQRPTYLYVQYYIYCTIILNITHDRIHYNGNTVTDLRLYMRYLRPIDTLRPPQLPMHVM